MKVHHVLLNSFRRKKADAGSGQQAEVHWRGAARATFRHQAGHLLETGQVVEGASLGGDWRQKGEWMAEEVIAQATAVAIVGEVMADVLQHGLS